VQIRINRYRKRFFYPAGLISLILLPTICIFYFYKHKAFEKLRVIEINWWTEEWGKRSMDEYSFEVYPKRKYIDINITGNDLENKIKLDFARLQIRKLVSTKDTTKGVHFHFDEQSKFWTFISAINICKIEKAKMFVPKDNDLWIYIFAPRPKPKAEEIKPIMLCGNGRMNFILEKSKEEVAKEKINYIHGLAKQFWLSGLLFILMAILTIKKLIQQT
jgi:hypothetical protein